MKSHFPRTSGTSAWWILGFVAAVPALTNAQSHDPTAHWQLADEQQFFYARPLGSFTDDDGKTVYRANLRTGHVEVLFTLPAPVGRREVEGIALRSTRQVCQAQQPPRLDCAALADDAVDLYVEMTVDPDNSGNDLVDPNIHVSLYHYEAQP